MRKNLLSKITFIICFIAILYEGVFLYPKWKQSGTEATISWDVSGYYMYLPAIFIYHDLKHCAFKDSILKKYGPTPDFQQAFLHPSGNYVMKYSSGQSILFAPFFFMAHAYAKISGSYPADGFSLPYQFAIGIGALFYCLLGLFLLQKLLLQFFPDGIVAVTLLAIVLASNYLNYAAIDGALTHNTLFTLYCILILTLISFYKKPSVIKAVVIGCVCGLSTLIRPSEIISLLLVVFWGCKNVSQVKQRFIFYWHNLKYVVIAGIGFAAFGFIQPAYWKYVSGNWIVYSYQDQGFSWLHPHLWVCFVGYRTGWLMYSPVMIFALIGFIFLYRRMRENFAAILIFTILFIYISFAWDCWWYGGGIGERCMVECYVLLSFPLACFFESVYKKRNYAKYLVTPLLFLFSYYNFWLTYEAHEGGLYCSGNMTGPYLWAILFKYHVDPNTVKLLDDSKIFWGNPEKYSTVYTNNFDSEISSDTTSVNAIKGKSIYLDENHTSSSEYWVTVPEPHAKWIRVSADFRLAAKEWDVWKMPQMVVKLYNKGSVAKVHVLRIDRFISDNETKNIWMDVELSDNPDFDKASISFFNPGSKNRIIIDNLKVIAFDE